MASDSGDMRGAATCMVRDYELDVVLSDQEVNHKLNFVELGRGELMQSSDLSA